MPASKAQRARTAERRTKAIQMRLAGADWQTIADRLDYASRGAACEDVSRALEKNLVEECAQVALLRHVTVQRYDRLQAAYWPKALQGDMKAADIILKIMAQRAKVEGTDAPQKVEVLTIDAIDAQIAALTDQLAAADSQAGEAEAPA